MARAKAKRREERVKLFATALSNSGVAAIVASVIAPLVTGRFQALAATLGFLIGAALHLGAQAILHYIVIVNEGAPAEDGSSDLAGDLVRGGVPSRRSGDGGRDVFDHPAG